MLAETFSHGLIRDFVVAFGTLFNNIKVNRRASSGEDSNTIAIPLSYAPQQRYIEKITQDLSLDRPVAISLPRMSFEMVSMNYAPDRKLNTMQRYFGKRNDTANTQLASTYSPVPYDFNFQLSVYIANIEDGTHIIEQILPYFTPEFTVSLKSVTELGMNMDLPLVLNSVNMEDSYEGGFDERRIIIWTLDFTMKGQLFGPVSNSGLINKIMVNIHPSTNTAAANNHEQIMIRPGMFANGMATNSSALSVAPNLITSNGDYGISTDIFNMNENANSIYVGANVHKMWDFRDSAFEKKVTFGPWAGNTSYDGWETYEANEFTGNGYVLLSQSSGLLRHSIVKTVATTSGFNGNNYQETAVLRIYANSSPHSFEKFYGKQFQNLSMRLRTNQTTGSGSLFNWNGKLRWLTTNGGEDEWSSGTVVRYHTTPIPSEYDVASYDTLYSKYVIVNFDMAGSNDWNDRIISGLEIDLFYAVDNLGPMEIHTDIDYIKISANTG